MFQLAVCAEMLYTEMPFLERVERLNAEGFQIEFWDWTKQDLSQLANTGAVFSNMSGYLKGNLMKEFPRCLPLPKNHFVLQKS